ncbi:MAG: GGDEF domain-containing protein, partial [Roseburia sp.]|nr:GGDEF domain-containing protein [Roseburia sp.]
MTNFGEHYNEELAQQEIEINKKTLREMVGAFIVLTAVWGLAFGRFPTVNAIVFSVTYAISAGFFIASVILFFKADPSDERMKCFFVTGICIISAAMNLMFSYHMVLVYVFPLIVAVQYKEKNVLWLSYALEVFLLPVSMIVGFYYGICDLNLLLQGNHTRTWYLSELADGFARIPFSKMPVVVIIVYRILPQLLILFVFVMIIQHTIGSMREDAYRIAELTYRKEVDSATRLYNKNKYEDMLANYYTMVERVAVVLWDIN